jgi:hypothetical protein
MTNNTSSNEAHYDHEDKESKTYMVKVKKYDSGTPEEFLKWRLTLN